MEAPQAPPPDAQQAPPPPADYQDAQQNQGAPQDQGQDDQGTSFQTFYDQLGSQGTWVQTDDYGYAFQPNVTDPNWAPYTDGHWVYTDEGWTWVSDEPWGWATYHYGRWANIDGTGWVWIPGYRWAPAWVSWRYGGGYCGWAPLPPGTFVGAEFGDGGWSSFHFGSDVDISFGIGAGCYNFVRVGDLGYPGYHGRYIDRSRNFAIINNTTNVTNINIDRGGRGFRGVNVGGPSLAEVNAHSHQHIQNVRLAEANQPGRSELRGNSLAVFAPRVNPGTMHQARPAQVGQTIAHPTFNRGESINHPLAVNSRLTPASPSAQAIQEAHTAQQHAPANARIATENTPVRTQLSAPLTSMSPVGVSHQATHAAPGAGNAFHPATPPNANVEHSAAAAPFTGQPANRKEEHSQAEAPFTGEPANRTAPQANSIAPVQTFHPQSQNEPNQAFHPNTSQTQVHHAENEAQPAQTFHPQSAPATQGQVFHPSNNPPAQTFHPQAAPSQNQSFHPANPAPAETHHQEAQAFHQQQGGGGGAPQVHQAVQHEAQHSAAQAQHTAPAAQHAAPAQHAQAAPAAAPATDKKQ